MKMIPFKVLEKVLTAEAWTRLQAFSKGQTCGLSEVDGSQCIYLIDLEQWLWHEYLREGDSK